MYAAYCSAMRDRSIISYAEHAPTEQPAAGGAAGAEAAGVVEGSAGTGGSGVSREPGALGLAIEVAAGHALSSQQLQQQAGRKGWKGWGASKVQSVKKKMQERRRGGGSSGGGLEGAASGSVASGSASQDGSVGGGSGSHTQQPGFASLGGSPAKPPLPALPAGGGPPGAAATAAAELQSLDGIMEAKWMQSRKIQVSNLVWRSVVEWLGGLPGRCPDPLQAGCLNISAARGLCIAHCLPSAKKTDFLVLLSHVLLPACAPCLPCLPACLQMPPSIPEAVVRSRGGSRQTSRATSPRAILRQPATSASAELAPGLAAGSGSMGPLGSSLMAGSLPGAGEGFATPSLGSSPVAGGGGGGGGGGMVSPGLPPLPEGQAAWLQAVRRVDTSPGRLGALPPGSPLKPGGQQYYQQQQKEEAGAAAEAGEGHEEAAAAVAMPSEQNEDPAKQRKAAAAARAAAFALPEGLPPRVSPDYGVNAFVTRLAFDLLRRPDFQVGCWVGVWLGA